MPKISIIIPAYNAEKTIGKALRAVGELDCPLEKEVLVVDDGSLDGTRGIAESFAGVRCVHQKNAGPAAARNHGAREASGDILFFTDADCVPRRDWIKKIMACFENEEISVVAGSYDIENPGSLLARCIHAEILYRHRRMPEHPRFFGSYNCAVRREAFLKSGGFDETYRQASGEDNDLSYRMLRAGFKIHFEKSALVGHHHPESVGRYLKEQFRHGYWRMKMYAAHPDMVRGDDYTFGKDIAETVLAVATPPVLVWIKISDRHQFSYNPMENWCLSLILINLLIQIFYGITITRRLTDGLYFALVMFLRAFARAAGLLAGAPAVLLKKRESSQ